MIISQKINLQSSLKHNLGIHEIISSTIVHYANVLHPRVYVWLKREKTNYLLIWNLLDAIAISYTYADWMITTIVVSLWGEKECRHLTGWLALVNSFFSQEHEKRIYVFSFAFYEIFLFIFHDKNELKMSIGLGLVAEGDVKILSFKNITHFKNSNFEIIF